MRKNLKIFRSVNNLTQSELAEKLGITSSYYNQIEKGIQQGSLNFWKDLKELFYLSGNDIFELMEVDKKNGN